MPQTKELQKSVALDKRIIFALDVDSADAAKAWVSKLEDHIKFYKVGLQLFLAAGFSIVDWIIGRNLEVMLDLKFFDVPQTVASAVHQLKGRGITFATVHGNDSILRAACEAKQEVKILAVTVLTSLDEADVRELGFPCSPEDLVLARARRALAIGCDGVVSSGLEVPKLRHELGNRLFVVVPGVRPVANREDDQKRVVDARQAFLNGADHIVVGRPIRQATDPGQFIDRMQADIEKAVAERAAVDS